MKMNNILKKDYATVAIISMALLGLSGCTKDPSVNHKPTVTVPSDKLINIDESLTLTATASDKDKEDKLSYLWRIAAKPKGSQLTLTNDTNKTISFKADKQGTYYLDFIAKDEFTSSKSKRVTILATSIVDEWRADLAKTKKENKLNDDENSELVEVLSSNYKIIFLENGKVEGDDSSSWKHKKSGDYTLNNKELKLIDENQLFIIDKIKEKDVKLFYNRVLKK
jgi:hypothetical protein